MDYFGTKIKFISRPIVRRLTSHALVFTLGLFFMAPSFAGATSGTDLTNPDSLQIHMVSARKYKGGKFASHKSVKGKLKHEVIDIALPTEMPRKVGNQRTATQAVSGVKVLAKAKASLKPTNKVNAPVVTQKALVANSSTAAPPQDVALDFADSRAQNAESLHLKTRFVKPEAASTWSPYLVTKSRMTSGRKFELETVGGKNYSLKNEIFVGLKHNSGWGLAGSAAFVNKSYDDSSKNSSAGADSTILAFHPSIYKDQSTNIYGYARFYLPTSESSQLADKHQYAYYSFADVELGGKWSLSNNLIPRYFTQNSFNPGDTYFYVENETDVYYKLSQWFSIGGAPYLQLDMHDRTAPGTTIELCPLLDFNLGKHALIEPRAYLPIYVDGVVNGGAKAASLANAAAELYLKLSI